MKGNDQSNTRLFFGGACAMFVGMPLLAWFGWQYWIVALILGGGMCVRIDVNRAPDPGELSDRQESSPASDVALRRALDTSSLPDAYEGGGYSIPEPKRTPPRLRILPGGRDL